jgi:hypothetical protein
VTYPIVAWYAERGILVSVDAMRPPEQVGREILAALEVMRPLVDHVPGETQRAVDLTSLASPSAPHPSLRLIGLSGRGLLGQVAAHTRAPSKISTLPGGNAGEVSGYVPAAGIPDLGLSEQYAIDAY